MICQPEIKNTCFIVIGGPGAENGRAVRKCFGFLSICRKVFLVLSALFLFEHDISLFLLSISAAFYLSGFVPFSSLLKSSFTSFMSLIVCLAILYRFKVLYLEERGLESPVNSLGNFAPFPCWQQNFPLTEFQIS